MLRFTFGAFVCACVCLCVHGVFGSDASLCQRFNWLIMVTMVTVLWKSSLPTTTEMPPAHLNVIFACCLHINRRLVRQSLVQRLFYWIVSHAVSYFEWHVDTNGVFVAVPPFCSVACTLLKVVVMFCVS